MKLILFVLLCAILSVQSKIIVLNKIKLIKEGDPATLVCGKPLAKWSFAKVVAQCDNCPSSTCNVDEAYKTRITASCNRENSTLHFNSTQLGDRGRYRCSETDYIDLQVGKYDAHLRPQGDSALAVAGRSYTLVCDKETDAAIEWFDEQAKTLSHFDGSCFSKLSIFKEKRFHFSCVEWEKRAMFNITQVTLRDDGKIFGCSTGHRLSLFRLRVKDVPDVPDAQPPANSKMYIIVACLVAVLFILSAMIIGIMVYIGSRRT